MIKREVINLDKSLSKVRLYSDAIRVENFLYASGQGPIDPKTGKTIVGDIVAQTRQTLENCKSILEKAGNQLEKVVKVSIFLKDMNDFSEMNKVYHEYFPDSPPVRSCVGVNSFVREDWKIEIEVISLS